MARRGGDASKQVVVSVVGVSGGEREKGVTGLGKSCLCNRFTKPQADQYHVDHISVLSQTDFSGRVVNNDHFLYWGECLRVADDGLEFVFQVVEQTEFIDDASFMPFKAGKMDPYIKRCCATKIQSAEKLMYICKNQLGIEKEYEQRVLPDGKVNVDGFLCVFDVSQVPNRSLERQVELTASILNNCLKTKRPVVLVTTKNDEANEVYVKEAEKLASRKEFKGNIPLVETSAHENVNVDCAFMTLANLVDRNRGRIRIVPFYEAARHRKEILDVATDAFQRLVRTHVLDYRSIWASTSKKLAQNPDFIHYVDLFGMDQAAKLFRRHVKKLKEEYLQRKVEGYMDLLPSILREFFPDLQSLEDGDWLSIQQRISEHPEFDRYFLRCNEDIPWSENTDLLDSADTRIPFDVLDSNEAETVFKNHVNALQAELEMREMRDRFKALLAETGYVTPGKRLDEVRVLFMGRESFDSLSEHDRQFIYEQHQKDITEKARQNFHELLLEQAELFYHVKSIAPTGTITQEDIRDITQTLQEDSRYKALDRLESERTLLLLQHLGFVHCPKKEHCPTFPNCMDCLIEKIIANKAASNSRPGSGTWGSKTVSDPHVNLVLLGNQGLAEDLQNVIRSVCEDDEFELDNQVFSLDYRSIDGDVSLPQNSFKTPEFTPHGVVCAYSNEASLEYVRESLEKSLLTQLEREESSPTPPITVLFAPDPDLDHNASQHLHDEGANLADSLQCTFMDVGPSVGGGEGRRFDSSLVTKALRSLITNIQHRNNSLNIYNSAVLPRDSQPDIRIIMCMLCGDPYSVENVLSPLLNHQWCVVTGEQSISLQTFLDDCKRRVEVIVSSYHGANAFREDLVHGFILVYSTKRKASLATLRAFSANIPNLPIQILAMTDTSSATAFFKSDISQQLITEGNAIADRLQAHFMTSTATCQQKTAFYTPFFKEVWDKKPEIEQAFNMEDPSGLDDSGEGTLERPSHHYHRSITLPPPRRNMPPRSQSAEGSSSEIYETVPTDGSLGDDLDEPLSPVFPDDQPLTPSDDSDIYSHIDNDEEEHLVKPSQFKKQHRFQQGWQDDSMCSRRMDDYWGDGFTSQAFTTGRRAKFPPPPTKPRPKASQTLKQPGKLNLKAYGNVTDAIGKLNLKDAGLLHSKLTKGGSVHAPLATPENMDLGPDYAAVKDAVPGLYGSFEAGDYGYSRVQDLPQGAGSKARRQRREKGRQVAPGKLEGDHAYRVIPEDDSSLEVSSPRDQQSPILPPGAPTRKDTDKTARRKQEKLRSREEARQREEERKRAKDEEKMKKAAEKEKEREKKKASKGSTKSAAKGPPQPTLEDFVQSPERSVPLFLEKCVYFIELEGLDSEGIYRVPGNKVHVEQLTTKFKEDGNVNFAELDIPVNAAATALKDYLKQLPPLLPQSQLMELTTIASIGDRSLRLLRLKEMLTGLPRVNFEVLKFLFQHFVRVAENCKLNSMDSKNLAICWWPTLLHTLQFSDIAEFESQRPHIEDIIQTMIDQFPFLFQGKEDYVMV
ncbi:rho GTPase-activating protein 190-like isoform X26 [Scylla paramamosain]|uniref:rho GTPase-activating protein 190-like isoform X26 n=1 Tax=Scylla paramamosain TaxID=85552 RepID=UPI003082877E